MAAKAAEFHPGAVAEAAGAAGWYRARSATIATLFAEELDEAISAVREAPLRWPPYLHGTRRYLLRRFPFSVVYLAEGDILGHHRGRSREAATGILGRPHRLIDFKGPAQVGDATHMECRQRQAIEIEGKKVSASVRAVYPGESNWSRGRAQWVEDD